MVLTIPLIKWQKNIPQISLGDTLDRTEFMGSVRCRVLWHHSRLYDATTPHRQHGSAHHSYRIHVSGTLPEQVYVMRTDAQPI